MTRRGFLLGTASAGALLLIGVPARAVTLQGVKVAEGKWTVGLPPIEKAGGRGAVVVYNANRALAVAHSRGLTRVQANNLLARVTRPALKANPGGLMQSVLRWGLGLGFAWALKEAIVDLRGNTATGSQTTNCNNLPVPASDIKSVTTGTYRSTGGATATSYQRTTAQGGTGTLPAPSGWTVAQQWNPVRVGTSGSVYQWEVVYSKNTPCGAPVTFPPAPDVKGATPNKDLQKQQDARDTLRKLGREVWRKAKDVFDKLQDMLDGDQPFPGEKTDPGDPPEIDTGVNLDDYLPNPSDKEDGGLSVPDMLEDLKDLIGSIGDLVFPDNVPFAGEEGAPAPGPQPTPTPGTNPTPTPSPTPGSTPTPSPSGVPADEDTDPGAVDDLPAFDKFANPFKTLFQPLTGALTPSPASCPSVYIPAVNSGYIKWPRIDVPWHCQIFGPFEGIIKTACIAIGGWVGVQNAMRA